MATRTIIESKKQRGAPMPKMCEICGRGKRERFFDSGINNDDFKSNPCFEDVVYNGHRFERDYAPFTNSKKTIKVLCKNFSHVKIMKARG